MAASEPDEAVRANARRGIPPPSKEGKVPIGAHFRWFDHAGFMAAMKAPVRMVSWRAKVELPPVIALERERAWPEVDRYVDSLRRSGCVVVSVHAYGYEIPNTSACEAHWWIDVLAPADANLKSLGVGRSW